MTCVTPRQVSNILSPLLSPTAPKTSALPRTRDNYRSLLSSYSSYTWYGNPLPLSPLQCARWGWKCTAKDVLECSLCKVRLHFVCAIPFWKFEQYNKICREFGIKIQTGHESICPMANKPYSEDILFGGKISLSYEKSEFISTFLFLSDTLDKVPEITLPGFILKRLWPVLPTIIKLLNNNRDCFTNFNTVVNNTIVMDVRHATCLILSLFGWRKYDDNLPTLHCKLCLRTLGLWNFKSLSSEASSVTVDPSNEPAVWNVYPDKSYSLHQIEPECTTPTPIDTDSESRSRMSSSTCSDGSNSTKPNILESEDAEMTDIPSGNRGDKPRTPTPSEGEKSPVASPASKHSDKHSCDESSPNKQSSETDPVSVETSSDENSKNLCVTENLSNDNCKSPSGAEKPVNGSYKSPTKTDKELESYKSPTKTDKESEISKSPTCLSENKSDESCKSPSVTEKSSEQTPTSPVTEKNTQNKSDDFKSPEPANISTRSLRSRNKANSADNIPFQKTPQQRKRKSKTSESPTTPAMNTRTRSGRSPIVSPMSEPMRKRRRSKVEVTESFINEFMKTVPAVLKLTSVQSSVLHVLNEHHHWCPWVSTLPTYTLPKSYRTDPSKLHNDDMVHTKVHTVEQTDEQGWETLLFHLTTIKSPQNAWLAVHNMLQDCVSDRV